MSTHKLIRTTKLSVLLLSEYNIKGHVVVYPLGTLSALISMLHSDILCVAPKHLHDVILERNPKAHVTSPQMLLRRGGTQVPTILWLYAARYGGFDVSVVLTRK